MSFGAHILFYSGYMLAALTVGVAINQLHGDEGEALVGGVAFFAACASAHAGMAVWHAAGLISQNDRRTAAEIARLRDGHRDLLAEIGAVGGRVDDLDARVQTIEPKRVAQPAGLKGPTTIDAMVDRLSKSRDAITPETASEAASMVRKALSANRVELHLQPVVALPHRRTVFYEAFTRLRDETGRLIMPHEFIPAAEQAGLMWQIDNLLLFRCAQLVRKPTRSGGRVGVFCNISLAALVDERFSASFLAFARNNRDLAGSLIFEVPQSAFERRTAAEARAMAQLAEYGFPFSIDNVSRIDMDLADLERANVGYLKVPARVIFEQMVEGAIRPRANGARDVAAGSVATLCARHGVTIVAERVESEHSLPPLLELDIAFAQGLLFGAPRAIRENYIDEIVSERSTHQKRAIA